MNLALAIVYINLQKGVMPFIIDPFLILHPDTRWVPFKSWCEDVNKTQSEVKYIPLYVKQEEWEKYRGSISKFDDVVKLFKMV